MNLRGEELKMSSWNYMNTTHINVECMSMTDEDIYKNLKNHPSIELMNAEKWKRLREIELRKEGKAWSR